MFGRPLVPAKSWTMLFRCVLAQCPWAWRILRYFDGKFRLGMDSRKSWKDDGNATRGWLAKPEATMVSERCHLAVSCCNSDGVSKTWVEKTRWTTATGLVLQWKNKWWVNGQFCSMSPQEYCVLILFTLQCQKSIEIRQTQDHVPHVWTVPWCSMNLDGPQTVHISFFGKLRPGCWILIRHQLQVGVIDLMSALCCTFMLQAGPHLWWICEDNSPLWSLLHGSKYDITLHSGFCSSSIFIKIIHSIIHLHQYWCSLCDQWSTTLYDQWSTKRQSVIVLYQSDNNRHDHLFSSNLMLFIW